MRANTVENVFSGSTALGGFLLVFLGVVISALKSFGGDTADRVLRRYQTAVKLGLVSFCTSIATVGIAMLWELFDQLDWLYFPIVGLFFVQLGLVFGVGVYVTTQIVLRD